MCGILPSLNETKKNQIFIEDLDLDCIWEEGSKSFVQVWADTYPSKTAEVG